MSEGLRIVLNGVSAKWLDLEYQLHVEGGIVLVNFSGCPEETLEYCRRFNPSILAVGEEFIENISPKDFRDFVDFGRRVRVVIEAEDYNLRKAERFVRMGCVGILSKDASPAMVRRALEAIFSGELWLNRQTVCTIVQNVLHDVRFRLTVREVEILDLLAEGLKNHEIAERLFISTETVRWHLRSLYGKLGTHDRVIAVNGARPGSNGDGGFPLSRADTRLAMDKEDCATDGGCDPIHINGRQGPP